MSRYVPPKALRDLLVGSLYWSGSAMDDPGRGLLRAARWYSSLVGQGHEGLPFQVCFDLGHLLLQGQAFPLGVSHWFDRYPEDERHLRVTYGNGLLAGFMDRAWFTRTHDLVVGATDPDAAVIFALEHMLGEGGLGVQAELVLQPARFPQLPWERISQEVREGEPLEVYAAAREAFEAWCNRPGALAEELEDFLQRLSLRGGGQPLGELELFELEHLHHLDTRERRLAARQLKQAEMLLPPVAAAALRRPAEVEEVDTDLTDEGTYPSGGLDGLANRGSWQNLVPSELLYMEDGVEVDTFTVRYVEGELLYYTRDGAQLRRRRRVVHLVIEQDEDLFVKYPEHPYRLDVLVRGLATRLVGDLLQAFERDSITVVLHLLGPRKAEAAELLRLRFATEVRRGEVKVLEDEEVVAAELADRRAKTYCIWIGRQPPFGPQILKRLESEKVTALSVELGGDGVGTHRRLLGLATDDHMVASMGPVRDRLLGALLGA